VFVVDNDKKIKLKDFTHGKMYSVMIIGYEKLRLVQDELKQGAPIDIVICDEGHRLKSAQNKSAQAIKELGTDKRIILSGTPLQNDLSEFFTMVDFINPGLLGKYSTFKREFETPILQSRVPNATQRNIEKGTARSEELAQLTSQFILRRTSEVIAKFLPPKTETVLFIQPTSAQAALYRAVLESPVFGAVLGSAEASLALINYLKKLCNSPTLLLKKKQADESPNQNVAALMDRIPPEQLNAGKGAKLQVLQDLLLRVRESTDDKVVLVSNYTSTLDILGQLLTANGLQFLRLDGSTPAPKRQGLVDRFNHSSAKNQFAFLLSAKAGGVGLNLIGASRLILFDVDWNPATDLQAMARIHRDGQKKPCYIYRFLIKGAIDEKIFQRQVTKTGLADAVVDSKKTGQHFTHEELRDLFRLDEGDACQSSEYLTGMGFVGINGGEEEDMFEDEPLKARLKEGGDAIAYVYAKTTS
jgi:DNA repair and recombination protein RAD54B